MTKTATAVAAISFVFNVLSGKPVKKAAIPAAVAALTAVAQTFRHKSEGEVKSLVFRLMTFVAIGAATGYSGKWKPLAIHAVFYAGALQLICLDPKRFGHRDETPAIEDAR